MNIYRYKSMITKKTIPDIKGTFLSGRLNLEKLLSPKSYVFHDHN